MRTNARLFWPFFTVAAVILSVLVFIGCSSNRGPYFQRSNDRKVHVMRDRIYNPADTRHERRSFGGEADVR